MKNISWDNYCIAYAKNELCFGYGKIEQSGVFKIKKLSQGRTGEIVKMLMRKMKKDCSEREDKRPYCGYSDEELGKIVYIPPDYDFRVFYKPQNKN